MDLFQSTPPCGGDPRPEWALGRPPYFNPRPHAGATKRPAITNKPTAISIHAPMRGRHAPTASLAVKAIFQSTPPCGGDGRM